MFRFMMPVIMLILETSASPLAQDQTHQHGHHATPTEAGQAAFATIQEIVLILTNNPKTTWSQVDIPALREHLIDMNEVTMNAVVNMSVDQNRVTFTAQGEGRTIQSIQRMLVAHAGSSDLPAGWQSRTVEIADGAELSMQVTEVEDVRMIIALGLIGVLTMGGHHQSHHLAMAVGHHPH